MKVLFSYEQFVVLRGLIKAYEALFLQFNSASIEKSNGKWGKLKWERQEGVIILELSDKAVNDEIKN